MINVGVFFGGKSVEHDISIITALQAMSAKPNGLNFIPLYCLPNGKIVTGDNLDKPNTYFDFAKNVKGLKDVVLPTAEGQIYLLKRNKIKTKLKLDCALLCNHGHGGEDGSLQGLLELAEIPYSSCGLPSSALCMDKDLTKILLNFYDIPTPTYVQVKNCEYVQDREGFKKEIIEKIKVPCIIKPASLGSSVGIGICEDEGNLAPLIEDAFKFDEKIIVEEYLPNAREFCCAVIYSDEKYIASKVVEVKKSKIYTFEEKYLSEKGTVKDKIPKTLEKDIKDFALASYKALSCSGVVRVDFLLDQSGKLFVNEINSIPGSLAFNLFDTSFEDLLLTLIREAKKRMIAKKEIVYKFNSDAISKYIEMTESYKVK